MSCTEQGGGANKGAPLDCTITTTTTTTAAACAVQAAFTVWLRALCRLVNLLEYLMIVPAKETAVCINTQRSAHQAPNTSIWAALTFKGLFIQRLQFACSAN